MAKIVEVDGVEPSLEGLDLGIDLSSPSEMTISPFRIVDRCYR